MLDDISPRLASALLFEQRQLLTMALRHQAPEREDYTPYFDIPDSYISPNGTVYKGLIGVFGKRMEQMRELLGYDLYVSSMRWTATFTILKPICRSYRHRVRSLTFTSGAISHLT